jgi:hypothetical protein
MSTFKNLLWVNWMRHKNKHYNIGRSKKYFINIKFSTGSSANAEHIWMTCELLSSSVYGTCVKELHSLTNPVFWILNAIWQSGDINLLLTYGPTWCGWLCYYKSCKYVTSILGYPLWLVTLGISLWWFWNAVTKSFPSYYFQLCNIVFCESFQFFCNNTVFLWIRSC